MAGTDLMDAWFFGSQTFPIDNGTTVQAVKIDITNSIEKVKAEDVWPSLNIVYKRDRDGKIINDAPPFRSFDLKKYINETQGIYGNKASNAGFILLASHLKFIQQNKGTFFKSIAKDRFTNLNNFVEALDNWLKSQDHQRFKFDKSVWPYVEEDEKRGKRPVQPEGTSKRRRPNPAEPGPSGTAGTSATAMEEGSDEEESPELTETDLTNGATVGLLSLNYLESEYNQEDVFKKRFGLDTGEKEIKWDPDREGEYVTRNETKEAYKALIDSYNSIVKDLTISNIKKAIETHPYLKDVTPFKFQIYFVQHACKCIALQAVFGHPRAPKSILLGHAMGLGKTLTSIITGLITTFTVPAATEENVLINFRNNEIINNFLLLETKNPETHYDEIDYIDILVIGNQNTLDTQWTTEFSNKTKVTEKRFRESFPRNTTAKGDGNTKWEVTGDSPRVKFINKSLLSQGSMKSYLMEEQTAPKLDATHNIPIFLKKRIGCLIVDEVHENQGKVAMQVLQKLAANARVVLMLSGTPTDARGIRASREYIRAVENLERMEVPEMVRWYKQASHIIRVDDEALSSDDPIALAYITSTFFTPVLKDQVTGQEREFVEKMLHTKTANLLNRNIRKVNTRTNKQTEIPTEARIEIGLEANIQDTKRINFWPYGYDGILKEGTNYELGVFSNDGDQFNFTVTQKNKGFDINLIQYEDMSQSVEQASDSEEGEDEGMENEEEGQQDEETVSLLPRFPFTQGGYDYTGINVEQDPGFIFYKFHRHVQVWINGRPGLRARQHYVVQLVGEIFNVEANDDNNEKKKARRKIVMFSSDVSHALQLFYVLKWYQQCISEINETLKDNKYFKKIPIVDTSILLPQVTDQDTRNKIRQEFADWDPDAEGNGNVFKVLIITRSSSTGINFMPGGPLEDKKRKTCFRMILTAGAIDNANVLSQAMARIARYGQVHRPEFTFVIPMGSDMHVNLVKIMMENIITAQKLYQTIEPTGLGSIGPINQTLANKATIKQEIENYTVAGQLYGLLGEVINMDAYYNAKENAKIEKPEDEWKPILFDYILTLDELTFFDTNARWKQNAARASRARGEITETDVLVPIHNDIQNMLNIEKYVNEQSENEDFKNLFKENVMRLSAAAHMLTIKSDKLNFNWSNDLKKRWIITLLKTFYSINEHYGIAKTRFTDKNDIYWKVFTEMLWPSIKALINYFNTIIDEENKSARPYLNTITSVFGLGTADYFYGTENAPIIKLNTVLHMLFTIKKQSGKVFLHPKIANEFDMLANGNEGLLNRLESLRGCALLFIILLFIHWAHVKGQAIDFKDFRGERPEERWLPFALPSSAYFLGGHFLYLLTQMPGDVQVIKMISENWVAPHLTTTASGPKHSILTQAYRHMILDHAFTPTEKQKDTSLYRYRILMSPYKKFIDMVDHARFKTFWNDEPTSTWEDTIKPLLVRSRIKTSLTEQLRVVPKQYKGNYLTIAEILPLLSPTIYLNVGLNAQMPPPEEPIDYPMEEEEEEGEEKEEEEEGEEKEEEEEGEEKEEQPEQPEQLMQVEEVNAGGTEDVNAGGTQDVNAVAMESRLAERDLEKWFLGLKI